MLLSFFGLKFPDANPWIVALLAASAATSGRCMLAALAQRLHHSRWVPQRMRDNLRSVARTIEKRRAASSGAFLLFAVSPLPSNALFLAYGLTRAPLALLAAPFFVGRVVSYSLAFAGGAIAAERLDLELGVGASIAYFVASQLASIGLVYLFTKIDWHASRIDRRPRWLAAGKAR
ncbi:MAG: hypothetical protein ABI218_02815 [Caldimonas sp.]